MEIVFRVSTGRVGKVIYTHDKPFDRDESDALLCGTIAFSQFVQRPFIRHNRSGCGMEKVG